MASRIPAGALILTSEDCRVLCQVAGIVQLRAKHRVGDSAAFRLLTDIAVTAYPVADTGGLPRQEPVNEEPEMWTVGRLARASGRSERTIRLDCQNGALPARKQGNSWFISNTDARTYIAGRR